jgi:hypothetical protein
VKILIVGLTDSDILALWGRGVVRSSVITQITNGNFFNRLALELNVHSDQQKTGIEMGLHKSRYNYITFSILSITLALYTHNVQHGTVKKCTCIVALQQTEEVDAVGT